jgi:hypothetical protein
MMFFKWFVWCWFMFIVFSASLLVIGITMQWLQGGVCYV